MADEVQHLLDVDVLLDELALRDIAGESIKQKQVLTGPKAFGGTLGLQPVQKDADRQVVGSEFAANTVIADDPPLFRLRIELAEDHTAGQMEETGDAGENLPLRSLASPGNSKDQRSRVGVRLVRHRHPSSSALCAKRTSRCFKVERGSGEGNRRSLQLVRIRGRHLA